MIKKSHIALMIFAIALCYFIWPWFFEKKLLFNELLSLIGLVLLAYKRFKIGYDIITFCFVMLLGLGVFHGIISLFRMDGIYFYLRNLVILYSMLAFFIGFYCLKYLDEFLMKTRSAMRTLTALIVVPLPRLLLERFNMSIIFQTVFIDPRNRWVPPMLIGLNVVYGFVYDSFTTLVFAAFLFFLFSCPGYKFFKQVMLLGFACFALLFIYLIPNLSLIEHNYSPLSEDGIYRVINSNSILAIDGNSTWRLVLWKQIIVDKFPGNIIGAGFGTPLLKYFPVEDFHKIPQLPYILGAHNSYVYLAGRLGLLYVILILFIYREIFREYFYHKAYYYGNKSIFLFWSFFASSTIALFNPALESPIFASGYWMLLGFLGRAIYGRKNSPEKPNLQS